MTNATTAFSRRKLWLLAGAEATRHQCIRRVRLSNGEDQRWHALDSAVSIYRNDQDQRDPSRKWLKGLDRGTIELSRRATGQANPRSGTGNSDPTKLRDLYLVERCTNCR